jgi:class 3 adenylate cyclase
MDDHRSKVDTVLRTDEPIRDFIMTSTDAFVSYSVSHIRVRTANGHRSTFSVVDDIGLFDGLEFVHHDMRLEYACVGSPGTFLFVHVPTLVRATRPSLPPVFTTWRSGRMDGFVHGDTVYIPASDGDRYLTATAPGLVHGTVEWQYRIDTLGPWLATETGGTIRLTDQVGATVQVQARYRMNGGAWTESERPIVVVIDTPWYTSWWAFLGTLGLLIGGTSGIVRWRTARIRRRAHELEEIVGMRTAELSKEKARTESLLLNILPTATAERLKGGETVIADRIEAATICFVDIVDFTARSSTMDPRDVVQFLDTLFQEFDTIVDRHGLEKIKTIGDAYMAAAGVPDPQVDHAERAVHAALDIVDTVRRNHPGLEVRVGLNTGPVVAAVVGRKKFAYDLWGDTVNVAARMEHTGVPMTIHVTESVVRSLSSTAGLLIRERGLTTVKGKGDLHTYTIERA